MPIIEYAPSQSKGVTTLMAVGQDEPGAPRTGAIVPAVKTSLIIMGVATLLGLPPRAARWLGVAGLGIGLALRR
jgi:hypothetical protein